MNEAEPEDRGRAADAGRSATAFEDTISGWVSEGTVPRWPAGLESSTDRSIATSTDGCLAAPPAPPDVCAPSTLSAPTGGQHVPPDPPPRALLGMGVCIGLALLGLGALILAVPGLLGQDCTLARPLSLISFAFGAALVIHRLLCRSD